MLGIEHSKKKKKKNTRYFSFFGVETGKSYLNIIQFIHKQFHLPYGDIPY